MQQEKSKFELLREKSILAILDGDTDFGLLEINGTVSNIKVSMPYLSGPVLCDVSNRFGLPVSYGWNGGAQSRWAYMDDLLAHCIQNERESDLLSFLFSKGQFVDKLKGQTPETIEYAYTYIVNTVIDPSKPMKYATVQQKITDKIYQENLRDDKGEYFGFGSHMYRHIYGMKLAEMHVDDWTIARLLGHRSLRNVKYYRKMSNKILADDTRKTRNRLSKMVLECLEGWEEEYEQIRFDDSLQ